MDLWESIKELRLLESKQDIENFKNKFGEKTYDDFVKAKDRLKNKGISTDITYHTKNTSVEEMNELIQSLYDKEKDKQRLRQIQGTDKDIRGKYNDFGIQGGYHIFQPLDYIASMGLGVNTNWITTGRYNYDEHPVIDSTKKIAKEYFNDYNEKGIKLYHFLNPETMYGEWIFAVYPTDIPIEKIYEDFYIKSTNFRLYDYKGSLKYDTKIIDIFNKFIPNVLEISMERAENGAYIENGVLIGVDKKIKEIKIPNNVTSIGNNAFEDCSELTNIRIPNNVTSIGSFSFFGCTSLMSIIITNSVKSVGNGAFRFCKSLNNVIISNKITDIGRVVFADCTSLESIEIPDTVTKIGDGAFSQCDNLINIIIPDSVISIGEDAFYKCDKLTIRCHKGSYAEEYAISNNIKVEYI